MHRGPLASLVAALAAAAAPAQTVTVTSTGQGPFPLSAGAWGASELSGIAWAGDDRFVAVGDGGTSNLWRLTVSIDATSGRILSAAVTGSTVVIGLGADVEGVAFLDAAGRVLAADEGSTAVRGFDPETGDPRGQLELPRCFVPSNVRGNFGLESLGSRDGRAWTANEEALLSDGPASTTASGCVVRLQRFGRDGRPDGQWAYRTEPISAMTSLVDVERSGVVDLAPVDARTVLVLEREFGGAFIPDFCSRIYLARVDGATDVSAMPSLAAGGFVPVRKALLWEGNFGFANFEGMALGPRLSDGCTSLVLVSDDGGGAGGQVQRLLALRACLPPPCGADLDEDGAVSGADLAALLASWGPTGGRSDLDGDGSVGGADLALLLSVWGACPG